ncbi:hypothetical protein DC3_17080 [Deinococcus cellulosilyticus NBRC 106333 = KACC 11606]|uniref:Uncharacterized protein n=2 Tax=Deinococcus cellulosilyticus TaxID=401558 RepID=A0A511MZQ9_DEIC1|nr:hypothetical protein DC3_17080 [Deinococcus cellulosilyticus NBRC 106333 = KACC 11606]
MLLFSAVALSLSSCTLIVSDDDYTPVARPGNVKVWYCPSNQRTYDFSFQVDRAISSYEALLVSKGGSANPNTALGSTKIYLRSPESGTFRNSVTYNQDQVGVTKLSIIVKPSEPNYDLYVRATAAGSGETSSFVRASSYVQDCR